MAGGWWLQGGMSHEGRMGLVQGELSSRDKVSLGPEHVDKMLGPLEIERGIWSSSDLKKAMLQHTGNDEPVVEFYQLGKAMLTLVPKAAKRQALLPTVEPGEEEEEVEVQTTEHWKVTKKKPSSHFGKWELAQALMPHIGPPTDPLKLVQYALRELPDERNISDVFRVGKALERLDQDWWSALEPTSRLDLSKRFTMETLEDGHTLWEQDQKLGTAYFILDGTLRLSTMREVTEAVTGTSSLTSGTSSKAPTRAHAFTGGGGVPKAPSKAGGLPTAPKGRSWKRRGSRALLNEWKSAAVVSDTVGMVGAMMPVGRRNSLEGRLIRCMGPSDHALCEYVPGQLSSE